MPVTQENRRDFHLPKEIAREKSSGVASSSWPPQARPKSGAVRRGRNSAAARTSSDQDLLRQIFVEECRQLAKMLLGLGRIGIAGILRVRLAFEHVEIADDAGLTQLAMHTHRVGQEQVTRARRENGRREAG